MNMSAISPAKKLRAIHYRARRMGLLREYGADLRPSSNATSKYMYRAHKEANWVHFGEKGMEDYWDHDDDERRESFRRRMWGIRLKDGRRAVDVIGSPAYLSYFLLW